MPEEVVWWCHKCGRIYIATHMQSHAHARGPMVESGHWDNTTCLYGVPAPAEVQAALKIGGRQALDPFKEELRKGMLKPC